MVRFTRIAYLFFPALFFSSAIPAQQTAPTTEHPSGRILLDVVVAQKSGPPLAGLQQQDFTILDDRAPQTISSFKAVSPRDAGQSVILVMDALNTGVQHFNYAKTDVGKFLRSDEGHLAYPTALTTLTDKGLEIEENFTTDGNALGAALDRKAVGLRGADLARSAGVYGQSQRVQLSMQALHQLLASSAQVPGRKLIIWLSPGWPAMGDFDSKEQQKIFRDLVWITDHILQAHVTLYSVDPLGASDTLYRDSYYKDFLKGVTKPSQVSAGNMGLQALSVVSGGLAVSPSNDVAGMVRECLNASAPYYEISFDAPPPKRAGEYHRLEIKLAQAGLTARTLRGYYAQPGSRD